jgi:hypothetical protein
MQNSGRCYLHIQATIQQLALGVMGIHTAMGLPTEEFYMLPSQMRRCCLLPGRHRPLSGLHQRRRRRLHPLPGLYCRCPSLSPVATSSPRQRRRWRSNSPPSSPRFIGDWQRAICRGKETIWRAILEKSGSAGGRARGASEGAGGGAREAELQRIQR